jgi:hypothetical protein
LRIASTSSSARPIKPARKLFRSTTERSLPIPDHAWRNQKRWTKKTRASGTRGKKILGIIRLHSFNA